MRIISGKLRGRRLETPKDKRIRPTSDKVKEAVFSMVLDYIHEESICVDLFSGTGNLGLEAISRGAKQVYFGDKSRDSIALLRENIQYCKVEEQAVVIPGDYSQLLSRIRGKADVFFLDPPYNDGILRKAIEMIADRQLLQEEGIIVAEHDVREQLPQELFGLQKIKEKRYGSVGVTVYQAAAKEIEK